MVSVFTSSMVGRGFEPGSGQTKDYINFVFVFSAKHAALRRKSIDWLARNQDNGATCLSADCCRSELALYTYNSACWSSTKRTSSSSH